MSFGLALYYAVKYRHAKVILCFREHLMNLNEGLSVETQNNLVKSPTLQKVSCKVYWYSLKIL